MTATSRAPVLQFGPEWMRTKHSKNPPSPPPTSAHAPPGSSSYSSLVTPAPQTPQETIDVDNPFKYSKDDLVRIYKEGGGRGGLGLEVERWECVRERSAEPVSMKAMSEAEKKLFTGPLNSEVRRRQSSDYLSPLVTPSGERPKLMHSTTGAASPLRERFGNVLARRNTGSDQPPLAMPRKLSMSSLQGGALASPREAGSGSPRVRGPTTPGSGFDGVLNGGDSWSSRRRASEGIVKGPATRGDGDSETVAQQPINEAEEDSGGANWDTSGPQDERSGTGVGASDPQPTNNVALGGGGPNDSSSATNGAQQDNPAAQSVGPNTPHSHPDPLATGPPPGLPDPASIEWSYLDPQGNIQGPFRADIMQKWFDEGYFAQDLLMKRTTMDQDWTTVGDLDTLTKGEPTFLSRFHCLPLGLSRRMESPFDNPAHINGANMAHAPFQPIPTRSMHPSFDPYFASNSTASNSPVSSFGAARFVNDSPDPMAFSGRPMAHMHSMNESPVGSRTGSLMGEPNPGLVNRRPGFNDPPYDVGYGGRPSLGGIGPARTSSVDSFGMGSPALPSHQGPWPPTAIHPGFGAPRNGSVDSAGQFTPSLTESGVGAPSPLARSFSNVRVPQDNIASGFGSIGGPAPLSSASSFPPEDKQDSYGNHGQGHYASGLPATSPYPSVAQPQQYTQSPSLQYASPALSHMQPNANQMPQQVPSPSPWNSVEESLPKRTGLKPFDPEIIPTSKNTVATRVAIPAQPSSIARPAQQSQPTSAVNEPSPWFSASQSATVDGWGPVQGPNSLTVSNLGQHNQQQEQEASLHSQPTTERREETPAAVAAPEPAPEAPAPVQAPKASRKSAASPAVTKPAVPQTPKAPSPSPSPATPSPVKPVWSTEDDKKKASGAAMGLREIQEAEAKKQEARKVVERERARAAAAAQAASQEETAPFTTSWGLPTSQAGKTQSNTLAKDAAAPASSSSSTQPGTPAPVWTNSTKAAPAKKTMKEIQEEEEKRKKLAGKETAAAAAARRAYAETTTKAPTPTLAIGGAWTTVGSNGRGAGGSASPAATRPAVVSSQPSAASITTARAPSAATTTVRMPSAASVVKVAPAAPKVEETPIAPSLEFMRWLSESLKGLNNSVNQEEIMSMLLSFPIEVDSVTMEIISESIYASSTTLDGRRFAQEFVSKRKADATSRKSSAAAGKQPSIADVVKAQPKPTQQSEWGGFKVVNKKKKGGKA